MIRDMVGRELASVPEREVKPLERIAFRANGLSRAPFFEDVSFDVRAGEIVGLGGLIGAGRSELARAIFGMYAVNSGTMELQGECYAPRNPAAAREAGVVYVPEERKRQGFVLGHSLESAMSIGFLDRVSRAGWIFAKGERARVQQAAQSFQIKFRSLQQAVGTLSGGNQQKALLARALESDPRFIILDEPTRGVDVGAKAEIHRLIQALADRGKPILLISSDLPELMGMSDRILVLHHGRISGEFTRREATQEALLLAASGYATK
jgi:ABC-type sugar transport system ATPase subunit